MTLPSVPIVPAMLPAQIDNVRRWETEALKKPQIELPVRHFLHAGMYARTVTVPADVAINGVLIKIPTMLVVNGHAFVYMGDDFKRMVGYNVLAAEANRKQIFIALEDTDITMLFTTTAKTVKEAEEQFTDEWHLLSTRTQGG